MRWYYQDLVSDCYLSIDIIKIWFRIVICPSVIFFPDIFVMISFIQKQIIAMGDIMLAVLLFSILIFFLYVFCFCRPVRSDCKKKIKGVHVLRWFFCLFQAKVLHNIE